MFVTAGTDEQSESLAELVDALRGAGLDAHVVDNQVSVDGSRVTPLFLLRAHPTPADLELLARRPDRGRPVVVLADRISEAGRDVLRDAGWGWLDRRGHVRLWAPGLRIEAPLPADKIRRADERRATGNVWTTVGLEVALHTLIHPHEPATARRLAPSIGRSVGATHELIARFTALGLIGRRTHLPLLPELFWEVAGNWPDDDWTPLAAPIEQVAERLSADSIIRVDERAATLGGARIPAAGDLPARCYVTSAAGMRRLRELIDRDVTPQCWVRTAPVEWIPLNEDLPADEEHPWAIAHPMLCALRLAADPARGREIVEAWGIVPEPAPSA